ncbi:hypothetical protein AB0P21_19765 [Kribbella sp. NPDC056861]|uniref:hypothetical protein n=1 Tax=Kribbella sp. NPDC056861 TaxID=3154857 RepID=UPI00341F4FDA
MIVKVFRTAAIGVATLVLAVAGTGIAAATQRHYDDESCAANSHYFKVWSKDKPFYPLCFKYKGWLKVNIYKVTKIEPQDYSGHLYTSTGRRIDFIPHVPMPMSTTDNWVTEVALN